MRKPESGRPLLAAFILAPVGLTALSSCVVPADSPLPHFALNTRMAGTPPERMSHSDLCVEFFSAPKVYGAPRLTAIEGEIRRRRLLTEDELRMAVQGRAGVGMSQYAVMAAWGPPREVHTHEGRRYRKVEWAYRGLLGGGEKYVYFDESGRVESLRS